MIMTDEDRYAEAERRLAVYNALPPIKRLERWYEFNCGRAIGFAMSALGEALRDWALEQQAQPPLPGGKGWLPLTCPVCEGHGTARQGMMICTCTKCNGSGRI